MVESVRSWFPCCVHGYGGRGDAEWRRGAGRWRQGNFRTCHAWWICECCGGERHGGVGACQ